MKFSTLIFIVTFLIGHNISNGQENNSQQDIKYFIKVELSNNDKSDPIGSFYVGYPLWKSKLFVFGGVSFRPEINSAEGLINIDTLDNKVTGLTYRNSKLSGYSPFVGLVWMHKVKNRQFFSAAASVYYFNRETEVALVDEEDLTNIGRPFMFIPISNLKEPIGEVAIDESSGWGGTLRLQYEFPIQDICHVFAGMNINLVFTDTTDNTSSSILKFGSGGQKITYVPGDFGLGFSLGLAKYF